MSQGENWNLFSAYLNLVKANSEIPVVSCALLGDGEEADGHVGEQPVSSTAATLGVLVEPEVGRAGEEQLETGSVVLVQQDCEGV